MDRNIVQELCEALGAYDSAFKRLSEHFSDLAIPHDIAFFVVDAREKALRVLAKAGFNEGGAGNNGKAV